jgi:hypothetical protein
MDFDNFNKKVILFLFFKTITMTSRDFLNNFLFHPFHDFPFNFSYKVVLKRKLYWLSSLITMVEGYGARHVHDRG